MPPETAFADFKKLLTAGPPELGPGPRPNVLDHDALTAQLAPMFKHASLSPVSASLARALIFLWHDHLDEAHTISQSIETPGGSFVHGIVHRREPDYSNAAYWFRRVGRHACFPEIAARAQKLLAKQPALATKLLSHNSWDPLAFILAGESAAAILPTDPQVTLLRELQAIETEVLLEHFLSDHN